MKKLENSEQLELSFWYCQLMLVQCFICNCYVANCGTSPNVPSGSQYRGFFPSEKATLLSYRL